MKKIAMLFLAGVVSISVAACEWKTVAKAPVKVVAKQMQVVVKPTLDSLDKRLTAVEDRLNKARAARGKFSPAPVYNPNYK